MTSTKVMIILMTMTMAIMMTMCFFVFSISSADLRLCFLERSLYKLGGFQNHRLC